LLYFLFAGTAYANPAIRVQFFNVYPSAVGTKLNVLATSRRVNHCGVCHHDFKSGGNPWNPYGQLVSNALVLFPNSDAGKSNAICSVRLQDPDGNTYSSLVEITHTNAPAAP